MYRKAYRRSSFWCSLCLCVRVIPIAHLDTRFTSSAVVVGLRDNWVENFKPNWKLKQLHRQRQELAALATILRRKQLFAFFHVFIATILWKTIQRAHRITPSTLFALIAKCLLAVICYFHLDVFSLWMEATNLTTINFRAGEWIAERVMLLYEVSDTNTSAHKLNDGFQYAVSFIARVLFTFFRYSFNFTVWDWNLTEFAHTAKVKSHRLMAMATAPTSLFIALHVAHLIRIVVINFMNLMRNVERCGISWMNCL